MVYITLLKYCQGVLSNSQIEVKFFKETFLKNMTINVNGFIFVFYSLNGQKETITIKEYLTPIILGLNNKNLVLEKE